MEPNNFFLFNEARDVFAAEDSQGEHDGKVAYSVRSAKMFDTRGEARDFGQNFGPDWNVVEY